MDWPEVKFMTMKSEMRFKRADKRIVNFNFWYAETCDDSRSGREKFSNEAGMARSYLGMLLLC
jgi:hypothetical protein